MAGPTAMRLRLGIALAVALMGPAAAAPIGCPELGEIVAAITGYRLTVPPAPNVEGWCIADCAVLRADGRPKMTVERLHLTGTEFDGKPDSLSLVVGGLRVEPALGDRTMDPRLRAALRLQSLDMMVKVRRSKAFDGLEVRGGVIALSGGTEVLIEADLKDADFVPGSALVSMLRALDLEWKNDGRLLRPAMEAAGERLQEGATANAAVEATRELLRVVIGSLPKDSLTGDTADELVSLVEAMPQGRGRVILSFESDGGIGVAQLALAALGKEPTGPDALARLFAGARLTVDWKPGIAP